MDDNGAPITQKRPAERGMIQLAQYLAAGRGMRLAESSRSKRLEDQRRLMRPKATKFVSMSSKIVSEGSRSPPRTGPGFCGEATVGLRGENCLNKLRGLHECCADRSGIGDRIQHHEIVNNGVISG